MHEQSETIERPRGYYNVYGGTQYPIPQEFSFEKQPYATQEEAVQSARWRSRMDAGHYSGASPAYGFSQAYQPSPQAEAFGRVLEALQDPRNQWIGAGPLSGLGKLAGAAKVAGSVLHQPKPRPTLMNGEKLTESFTDISGKNRLPSDLMSGSDVMSRGYDPNGPGFQRSWGLESGKFDYTPPTVRNKNEAAQYAQDYLERTEKDEAFSNAFQDNIFRTETDYATKYGGGSVPYRAPQHYSPKTETASSSPLTWGDLLSRRHDMYQNMTNQAIKEEGFTPEEAQHALRLLNLEPPGLKETQAIKRFNFRPEDQN